MDGTRSNSGSWQHFLGIGLSMAILDATGIQLSLLAASFQAIGRGRSLVCFMLAAPVGCIFATLIVFSKPARTRFPLLATISIIGRYALFWALLAGPILFGHVLLWLTRMSLL
jgi:hypothetical protein